MLLPVCRSPLWSLLACRSPPAFESDSFPAGPNCCQVRLKNKKRQIAIAAVIVGSVILIIGVAGLVMNLTTVKKAYTVRSSNNVNTIQTWMTLHYISLSFNVPESVLLKATNTTLIQARRQSIAALAKKHNETTAQLVSIIKTAISNYKTAP